MNRPNACPMWQTSNSMPAARRPVAAIQNRIRKQSHAAVTLEQWFLPANAQELQVASSD